MNQGASPAPEKKRPRLLFLGWVLLAASIFLCMIGPRLSSVSDVPSDIKNRMGDANWIGFAWILAGIAVGALALVCFAVEWMRRPGRIAAAHQQKGPQSK
ncbi:MAG: hypothetical protein LAO78_20695 [Acidobacteriia bacterium]|nr:hypothetical protein [Terriglobia bacterium]